LTSQTTVFISRSNAARLGRLGGRAIEQVVVGDAGLIELARLCLC
jgi:hypothetical protein